MAKKGKNNKGSTNAITQSQPTKPLTNEELYDVLEFAENYYQYATRQKNYPTTFTPQLTNQRLSSISVPRVTTETFDLDTALSDIVGSQKSLVGYAEFLALTDAVSKRSTAYLGNLPTFDYIFTCKNATEADYNTDEYKRDEKILKEFLSHFDPHSQFTAINRRTIINDAYYGVFRKEFENYAFEELPAKYCMITGRNPDWGFVFDFNMEWFLNQGISIKQYPTVFQKLWGKVFEADDIPEKYDPSNPLKQRNGVFSMWAQTSPLPEEGNFACFKFNSDIFATVPFLTSLFGDVANKDLVRNLQNNAYIIASQKILVGLIPLLKEQKSGSVRDAVAISSKTLGGFLGMLKQGLSDSVKIGGVPFSDVKDISFNLPTANMYDQYNATSASNTGVTSRFVYTTDKLTAAEVKYNALIDQMITEQVYPQYEAWLSSMVNSLTKRFKFSFKFSGTKFDKEERLERAEKLANRGIFVDQLYASAMGINKFELESLMLMSNSSSFHESLRLPPNSNTASSGDTKSVGGRQRKPIEDVADGTARKDDYEGE